MRARAVHALRAVVRWMRWTRGRRLALDLAELSTVQVADDWVSISIPTRLANMVALGDEIELVTPLTEQPIVMRVTSMQRCALMLHEEDVIHIHGEELR